MEERVGVDTARQRRDEGKVGWRRERWSDGAGYYLASIYSSQGWLDA